MTFYNLGLDNIRSVLFVGTCSIGLAVKEKNKKPSEFGKLHPLLFKLS